MAFKFIGISQHGEIHIYHSFDHLTAVAKGGKAPGELWWSHGIAIHSATNNIYVAEGSNDFPRVSVFSDSGEFLHSYAHKHMKSFGGIAIHESNVYVTDYRVHAVFHFKIEAESS